MSDLNNSINNFHSFSKSPAYPEAAFGNAVNIAGHVVDLNSVRADDIPWYPVVSSDTELQGLTSVARKNDLCKVASSGVTYKFNGTNSWEVLELTNGLELRNEFDKVVLRYHKQSPLTILTAENNSNVTSDNWSARLFIQNQVVPQFVSVTDKIVNGTASTGYRQVVRSNGSNLIEGSTDKSISYLSNNFAGIIHFESQHISDSLDITCFEYIGSVAKDNIYNKDEVDGIVDGLQAQIDTKTDQSDVSVEVLRNLVEIDKNYELDIITDPDGIASWTYTVMNSNLTRLGQIDSITIKESRYAGESYTTSPVYLQVYEIDDSDLYQTSDNWIDGSVVTGLRVIDGRGKWLANSVNSIRVGTGLLERTWYFNNLFTIGKKLVIQPVTEELKDTQRSIDLNINVAMRSSVKSGSESDGFYWFKRLNENYTKLNNYLPWISLHYVQFFLTKPTPLHLHDHGVSISNLVDGSGNSIKLNTTYDDYIIHIDYDNVDRSSVNISDLLRSYNSEIISRSRIYSHELTLNLHKSNGYPLTISKESDNIYLSKVNEPDIPKIDSIHEIIPQFSWSDPSTAGKLESGETTGFTLSSVNLPGDTNLTEISWVPDMDGTNELYLSLTERRSDGSEVHLGTSINAITPKSGQTAAWKFDNISLQGGKLIINPVKDRSHTSEARDDEHKMPVRYIGSNDGSEFYWTDGWTYHRTVKCNLHSRINESNPGAYAWGWLAIVYAPADPTVEGTWLKINGKDIIWSYPSGNQNPGDIIKGINNANAGVVAIPYTGRHQDYTPEFISQLVQSLRDSGNSEASNWANNIEQGDWNHSDNLVLLFANKIGTEGNQITLNNNVSGSGAYEVISGPTLTGGIDPTLDHLFSQNAAQATGTLEFLQSPESDIGLYINGVHIIAPSSSLNAQGWSNLINQANCGVISSVIASETSYQKISLVASSEYAGFKGNDITLSVLTHNLSSDPHYFVSSHHLTGGEGGYNSGNVIQLKVSYDPNLNDGSLLVNSTWYSK